MRTLSQIDDLTKSLVLGFFSKIDAKITEKNGLYEISVPENYQSFFKTDFLQITFDSNASKQGNYELVLPGSNILLKILNKCLDFGPIVTGNLSSNTSNSRIIRFYFYVIFESIKSKSELVFVDVDLNSKKIISIPEFDISINNKSSSIELESETVDECYIESINFLERDALKSKIYDFKKEMAFLEHEELDNINSEYKKRKFSLEEKFNILRSKGASREDFDKLINENEMIREEEKILIENTSKKYAVNIDIALFASLILT